MAQLFRLSCIIYFFFPFVQTKTASHWSVNNHIRLPNRRNTRMQLCWSPLKMNLSKGMTFLTDFVSFTCTSSDALNQTALLSLLQLPFSNCSLSSEMLECMITHIARLHDAFLESSSNHAQELGEPFQNKTKTQHKANASLGQEAYK